MPAERHAAGTDHRDPPRGVNQRKNSYLKIAAGLNLFLHGHHAKLQAEFASIIANANLTTTPALHQFILQAQLFL